jgi:hypothetical protein
MFRILLIPLPLLARLSSLLLSVSTPSPLFRRLRRLRLLLLVVMMVD